MSSAQKEQQWQIQNTMSMLYSKDNTTIAFGSISCRYVKYSSSSLTSTKFVCFASLTVTRAWTSSISFCFSSSSKFMYHFARRVFPARFWIKINRIYHKRNTFGGMAIWVSMRQTHRLLRRKLTESLTILLNYLIFKDGGEERCPRNAGTGTFLGALWEYYFAGERKPREDWNRVLGWGVSVS